MQGQQENIRVVRIALGGFGTVGQGVYELIRQNRERWRALYGFDAVVKMIVVRDLQKLQKNELWLQDEQPASFSGFGPECLAKLNKNEVDLLCELVGGDQLAVHKGCIVEQGVHVVTANKAVIAENMDQYEDMLGKSQSSFGLEAAVCGGIPIINSLLNDFVGDHVTRIAGIMNGTTNYILSRMEAEGVDYAPVLKDAQDLGYAEADPAADVEGWDARAKLMIMAKLAFGIRGLSTEQASCCGISEVSGIDFEYAKMLNCTIRLLGIAERSKGNDNQVNIYVAPHFVPLKTQLGAAQGPTNVISVQSRNQGEVVFVGPGAGRFPTATSVVNDIVRIGKSTGLSTSGAGSPSPFKWASEASRAALAPEKDGYASKFYIRIELSDGLGITKEIGQAAESCGISINAMFQNPIADRTKVSTAITTDNTTSQAVKSMCEQLKKFQWCQQTHFYPMMM